MTSLVLSGCSSLTDTVAASTQTFTNVTDSTSGSSTNISKDSSPSSSNTQKAIEFARINWMNLSANMSKGEGEHLAAMASLLAVQETQKTAFYKMTQQKFVRLFKEGKASAPQLVEQLQQEVTQL
ncbi:MAG: DUF3015 family protein [Methylococcales bacterium]|nr:DUF3015 family protein [Methylococcales bacterium]